MPIVLVSISDALEAIIVSVLGLLSGILRLRPGDLLTSTSDVLQTPTLLRHRRAVRLTLGWILALSKLVLLLFLVGCATRPPQTGPRWYGQTRPGSAQDFPVAAGTEGRAIEVDLEAPSPQQLGQLRRSGISLPSVSERTADPRTHSDFVDRRVTAVGYGLTVGGYLLYCEGLPLPVLVPESLVDLEQAYAEPLNVSIYPDRHAALEDLDAITSKAAHSRYTYYRGAGGLLIVPTLFSPATTPRIAQTMLAVRAHLADSTQRELKVLLLTLTGTQVLKGVFSRVLRVGSEPELPPLARQRVPTSEAPAARQWAPHATATAPKPAPMPARTAPARGLPEPSPGLVQALSGNNPTPQIAAGARLPQDVSVRPTVPGVKPLQRPVGSSATQNAQLQADIQYLEDIGATNIRVNQQQLKLNNEQRVGINRPDLQFDYNGRRYHVEYETPASGRGSGHQTRLSSNDSDAEIILLIVP